jgi:HAD superfamily hydrolase (TIGR01549 family)
MPYPPIILPRAILFDMDGTLTQPMLDFPRIRSDLGIGNRPILEALAQMASADRSRAESILLRHEDHAAAQSTLSPGCRELLAHLRGKRIPTALITRNSRRSVQIVLDRHNLSFDTIISREDGPFKPDPYPLKLACRTLQTSEPATWMVGDGQYDVEAALAAGIASVWISHRRARPFDATPWLQLADLLELLNLMQACEAGPLPDANSPAPGPGAA